MSKIFRDYDQAALDAQYDQRVWSPHMDEVIRRYAESSDAARARIGEPVTHAYGPDVHHKLVKSGIETKPSRGTYCG